jgi:transposase
LRSVCHSSFGDLQIERQVRIPQVQVAVDDQKAGLYGAASSSSFAPVRRGAICPTATGPYTTAYNRFNRWRKAGIWDRLMDAVVKTARFSRPSSSASAKVTSWALPGEIRRRPGGPSRRRARGACW